MPRPRMFDEDRALDAAMRLFWRQGYEATSTQDLCEATGLARSSIYNTFAGKHELFLRALARYLDEMAAVQRAIVEDPGLPVGERLRALFASIIDVEEANRRDGRGIGCLGVNSSTELSGRDAEAARLLQRDAERRLAVLRDVIAGGQRAGEISSGQSAGECAAFLNAVIAGMRVTAQNGAGRAVLESIAAVAVGSLVSP